MGATIGALAALHRAGADAAALDAAVSMANATLRLLTDEHGVLTEGEDITYADIAVFKGIFAHRLGLLASALAETNPPLAAHYRRFLCTNARVAIANASSSGKFAARWQGPINVSAPPCERRSSGVKQVRCDSAPGPAAQTSALLLLATAAQANCSSVRSEKNAVSPRSDLARPATP
jgi:predicted alpha-1,6-mannanase (GH76 family)